MAAKKRTTHRSPAGKKLYAKREKTGEFEDIQTLRSVAEQQSVAGHEAWALHCNVNGALMSAILTTRSSQERGFFAVNSAP